MVHVTTLWSMHNSMVQFDESVVLAKTMIILIALWFIDESMVQKTNAWSF